MEYRAVDAADIDAVGTLALQSLGQDYHLDAASWRKTGRVLADRRTICAAYRLLECPQYYGGRPVSTGAQVDLMVDPACRGRGLGRRLVMESHRELIERGAALATSYPTIPAFFRTVGWEVAGVRVRYRARAVDLTSATASHVLPQRVTLQKWDLRRPSFVSGCYDSVARGSNGHFQRSTEWWTEMVLAPAAAAGYTGHLVRQGSRTIGYVVHRLVPSLRKAEGAHNLDVDCVEMAATTHDAWVAIMGLIGRLATPESAVYWWGGSVDPAHLYIGPHALHAARPLISGSSVLDAHKALEQRGYPTALATTMTMAISDVGVPSSPAQVFQVSVADGRATVIGCSAKPSHDTAWTDIRTFASLYAGFLTPHLATRLSRLRASPDVVETLAALLPANPSWTREYF